MTFNQQRYTYGELAQAVYRLRGALRARGIRRRDTVAIQLPNSPHFVIAHLAVLSLGAVSVPLHIQLKAREIAAQVEDAEAVAIVAWDHLSTETELALSRVDCCRLRIYLGDSIPAGTESLVDLISKGDEYQDEAPVAEDDTAVILYTSGVSGKPRGVELTHANISAAVEELSRALRLRETDRFLAVLPFTRASGLSTGVHLPLANGAELIPLSRFHPGDALEVLRDRGVSVMVGTPYMFSLIAGFPTADRADLSKLRYPISVDAKLAPERGRDVEERLKVHLFEAYGCTETCGPFTINLFPGLGGRENVGQPLSGMELAILGEDGSFLPPGKSGQIVVRGPLLMKGYLHRPEKSRQSFREGWFVTGDVGYLDDSGSLVVTGHSTELINKGGFRVYSREVEDVLEGLPHIREVAVVGIADTLYGEEVKACVVLKDGATISPSEIIEYAKERLAMYKCPKIVKFYKELPHEAGGKILRSDLKDDRG
ncbi:AMP-binding protein [candidate division KSB1 bacterium]|nr:AMP-binding protein [candidate division KSB1 bacterium]